MTKGKKDSRSLAKWFLIKTHGKRDEVHLKIAYIKRNPDASIRVLHLWLHLQLAIQSILSSSTLDFAEAIRRCNFTGITTAQEIKILLLQCACLFC